MKTVGLVLCEGVIVKVLKGSAGQTMECTNLRREEAGAGEEQVAPVEEGVQLVSPLNLVRERTLARAIA